LSSLQLVYRFFVVAIVVLFTLGLAARSSEIRYTR
jgi:uncharacterized membrane protein YjgN (DUF898 family)